MRLAPVLAAAALALAALVQDPIRPARAPVGADPLPPVPDPPTSRVERRDLLHAFSPGSGFEGFYRLSSVVEGGVAVRDETRGFLAIGRRHLALHILQGSPQPGLPPMVQAGFRTYRVEDGELITTSLVGHDNLGGDATLHFEPIGMEERRGLVRTATTLRVVRGEGAWMEFVRIE